MPRFDGTGPLGSGAGSGWGLGPCGAGRAWRKGRGLGRSWGYPYRSQITKKEETELLNEETKALEDDLKVVKERLTELKTRK